MTKIMIFLTNILVKNKKMCYNVIKLKKEGLRKGETMWVSVILSYLMAKEERSNSTVFRLSKPSG